MEIPSKKRESHRTLGLDKGFRDAVADYLRRRWPSGTAKHAARFFDITVDRAREATVGRASLTTIEAIFKKGGWLVALPILADVIGQQIVQHLIELRKQHESDGGRLAALVGDWGSGPDPGRDDSGFIRSAPVERRQFVDRRARQG